MYATVFLDPGKAGTQVRVTDAAHDYPFRFERGEIQRKRINLGEG
jgi:hypothetical protein